MYQHISDAYDNRNRFAICLLELNEKEIKRLKSNCIHCDGLSKVNNQVIYEKLHMVGILESGGKKVKIG